MRRVSEWRRFAVSTAGALLLLASPAFAQEAPATPAQAAPVDPERLALAERLRCSRPFLAYPMARTPIRGLNS
jgi:hypothetical protein